MVRVHVHKRAQARDIGKSNAELLNLIKTHASNPALKESDVGAAIRVLASRGISPRTGLHVGMREAMKVVREMGDFASS